MDRAQGVATVLKFCVGAFDQKDLQLLLDAYEITKSDIREFIKLGTQEMEEIDKEFADYDNGRH